jgi:hypothetical protein
MFVAVTFTAALGGVGVARAQEDVSTFFPRFTLLELQYPQGIAVSVGSWLRIIRDRRYLAGLVGDLELGLSGATVAIGPGASAAENTSYEKAWSFGIQGTIHRTWPWWAPWLPTSATFVGGEIFADYFAFRCSVGALWPLTDRAGSSPFVVGGCGVGLP